MFSPILWVVLFAKQKQTRDLENELVNTRGSGGGGGIVREFEIHIYTAAAKSLQSCPTLCGPIDGSPPGSSVPGILQARTLEWVAISFSNA